MLKVVCLANERNNMEAVTIISLIIVSLACLWLWGPAGLIPMAAVLIYACCRG